MNNKKKLSESLIKQGIINEAKIIKRKKEIDGAIKKEDACKFAFVLNS